MPEKYRGDQRNNSLAAETRRGDVSLDTMMIKNAKPLKVDSDLIAYVKNRLGLNDIEFDEIMMCPVLTYRDYPNYKKRFELLRPSFNRLAKANLVPLSFYLKYHLPAKALK